MFVDLEGNDVASNLKWALASRSVVMMPRPKFETWFLESRLVPGQHFIPISDDFSDIEDQFEYYVERPKLCREIIREANDYVRPYKDRWFQFQLAGEAVRRYACMTGQE